VCTEQPVENDGVADAGADRPTVAAIRAAAAVSANVNFFIFQLLV
jgi:hypothetical protein